MEKDLTIIPVLNKIDLPAADPDWYAEEIAHITGCEPGDVLRVSGKTGMGVKELLDEVVKQVPAPVGDPDGPARAMIFDSVYDAYRGVVTYVRVVDGRISPREKITMMSTGTTHDLIEVGIISPEPKASIGLGVGEVGYLITGVKDVRQSRVGDTVTAARGGATEPLVGYRDPKPMVYSGLYPLDGSDYPVLRDAWTSCVSTTPPWRTSRRRRWRSGSGSAADSSDCCTWRSPATASSASSGSS